ncbi:MAG: TonB-dependent receptor [Pedobacter sp.]|nr:MAG: TonB-dependent receptor [Pedobacter sp.]
MGGPYIIIQTRQLESEQAKTTIFYSNINQNGFGRIFLCPIISKNKHLMKDMLKTFITFCFCLIATYGYSQSFFTITSRVTGSEQKSISGATILLKRASDSVLVKTEVLASDGKFSFTKIAVGTYQISIMMMGYEKYTSETITVDSDKQLSEIRLKEVATALQGVVIAGEKKLVEQKIDRTVVNVDAMLSAASSTVMDVLEKSPGVMVDQNGVISLIGKSNVTIFIDGKPTYLSGSDLDSYLRSLSASTVDQIELMTNPPAKYDAAGNGGVINIKTKKNKIKGFNGGMNLSYTQGVYAKTNNSGNFNYRTQKFNFFGNLSMAANNNFADLDINRYFQNVGGTVSPNFLQNSFIRRMGESYNTRLGLDYYASDKTTFGIGFTGLLSPSREKTKNVSELYNANNVLDSSILALNNQNRSFQNGGVNFNYRRQIGKKGGEFSADLDYLRYQTDADQVFDNSSYFPNGGMKDKDLLTGALPAQIDIYSAKADYNRALKNGYNFETGLKTSYIATDNVADYFYTRNAVTSPDYDKTNHFLYKEQINAAYANLSKDFKRFSMQFGLRLENTNANGHQLGNIEKPDSTFKRDYTGLFPTAYVLYRLDSVGHQSLNLNYGRRIDRPFYQDLNPFLSPLDKFTFYTGNPFLKPSYSHNVELRYSYKKLSATLNYGNSRDQVGETIEIVDGIYYSRPGNLGSTVVKGMGIDGSFDFTKAINFNFSARATNIATVSNFYTGVLNTQGTYYFGRGMFQFKLPKDWSVQLDGSYQTRITNAQFSLGARGRANLAVGKKLSNSSTIRLIANDLFYTWVNVGVINNLANTQANWRNIGDSRTVALSFNYRFGKVISDLRKHNANGAEQEQGRVKN